MTITLKSIQLLLLSSCLYAGSINAQNKREVTIKGFAPSYVGSTISICELSDYLSSKEAVLANTTVQADSTFSVSFPLNETQRINLIAGRNRSFMYADPGRTYEIFVPEKDRYEPYRADGNKIELSFISLDSSDINYKLLSFQQWMDEYVANYYHLKNVKPIEFVQRMDEFKTIAEQYYAKDPSVFLKTYIKYSVATLDDIQFAAERNRYEKYDFYLKNAPVFYRNDAYMEYMNAFYDRIIPRLELETNNRVYLGVLKSSPSLVMRALGGEVTLSNLRLRELVMIKALAEEFYSKEFPQTNIITILDSISKGSMFAEHAQIAGNIRDRLTELSQGGKAPDFVLKTSSGQMKTLNSYKGKYLYLHFYDPSKNTNSIELAPLIKLHNTYKDQVQFISILLNKGYTSVQEEQSIAKIPWDTFRPDDANPIWKTFRVDAFPSYVLIDPLGYIVQAPALGPMPNGQYLTIDQTFFFIQQAMTNEKR